MIKFQGRQLGIIESLTGEPADSFEVAERRRRVRLCALGDAMLGVTPSKPRGSENLTPWLVWRDKDFKGFCLLGACADSGFVTFLLTGCDRNPWVDERGGLDPGLPAYMRGGRVQHRDCYLDDPN